jgi:hypothetical protein
MRIFGANLSPDYSLKKRPPQQSTTTPIDPTAVWPSMPRMIHPRLIESFYVATQTAVS